MRSKEGTAAIQTQPFVGRAGERARLVALVESARVVAVIGPAGIGKSALARAAFPDARVISLADCRDIADIDSRISGGDSNGAAIGGGAGSAAVDADGAAPAIWDDVPDALAAAVAERAGAARGRVVVVARVGVGALPGLVLAPLDDAEARALVAALDAADPLPARIAAGGKPGDIVRRLAQARAAIAAGDAPAAALEALLAGRFAEALDGADTRDGDPLVAAAAACGLDALDRAAALLHAHGGDRRAPLVALALAWRRGELRACVESGARLMAALDETGDALGCAVAAAIVARAAFGLGELGRAEALLRAVEGYVTGAPAPSLAAFADLGRMLVAAARGDWAEARRRVASAAAAVPGAPLVAVERSWADGGIVPARLDAAARALYDLRAAERALADGRVDDANRYARAAERFWRDAGAGYERALALLARTEAVARAGDRQTGAKLRVACGALADGGGYRIVQTALALIDAFVADRDGELGSYVAALARAQAHAAGELHGGALAEAGARVGLPRRGAVADGQPMRDRVARLGLARPADRLCAIGGALWLLADDDALPAADAVADVDEGTLTAGGREQSLAPQLMALLEAVADAGSDGITPEALYHAVWRGQEDYHALRHRNAVYVAVNRLRAALEPIAGKDAVRSTATHYVLAPGLRVAVCRAVRRLDLAGFADRAADGDARAYARRHGVPPSQARWELALHRAVAARGQ